MSRTLEQLTFDNSYRRLPGHFYSRVNPTPLEQPHLISVNHAAAELIDLHPGEALREEFIHAFSGHVQLPGSEPLAMLYAGHQFGHYVPQLGDGRAILLGEVRNLAGKRWDLHLKGAGVTPYSRRGDGRAVLRSSIREYLCSEAMHHLGIPSSRALCLIGSGEEVYREQVERGAMVLRMAPSHVRFGSFEVFYYRNQFEPIRQLADYTIEHHFPELSDDAERYLRLFESVVRRTAELISQWQQVGFAHGVMNTDNMSILGLTLDYGPFGFLDDYEPGYICNHSDHTGRYAFDQQPHIGLWNLSCLGQALLPLFDEIPEASAEKANTVLATYEQHFTRHYAAGMCSKLGLQSEQAGDRNLIVDLLDIMARERRDYTNTLRDLGHFSAGEGARNDRIRDQFIDREAFDAWAGRYAERLRQEQSDDRERRERMNRANPKYILRNHLAEIAIRKARDEMDFTEIERLRGLLARPFDEQPELDDYAKEPPDWAREIAVSCSS